MSQSIPASNAETPQSTQEELPFFAISLTKLAVMCICTLGMYQVYWFYRNWHLVKNREKSNIYPAARSIFAIFFCYQLLSKIRQLGTEKNINSTLLAGPLATGWIISSLLYKLQDPYWWISYFAFVFLLPAQAYANKLNLQVDPTHNPNSTINGWNWLAVILGGLVLLLAIIGTQTK